jgi:hypothetical protein
MQVRHTRTEFFLQFGQSSVERAGVAHLVDSLVTTPSHAKAILNALRTNIERYEERFGPIPEEITETEGSA